MHSYKSRYYPRLIFLIIGLFLAWGSTAQEDPPIPVQAEVRTARWLDFGAFTSGVSGGTLTMDWSGTRTATGDVIPLSFGPTPSSALFDVTANRGTIIHISTTGTVALDGGSGGKIYLNVDSFSTGKVFVHMGDAFTPTSVEVGGTLTIGSPAASPAGDYTGTFTLTFINE